MTILVTGGAGFICSNFVCGWLRDCLEPVGALDKLTYAVNLDNLREVADHPGHTFVLGDNILYGHDLAKVLAAAHAREAGATMFAYHVTDPERYGVVEFGPDGRAVSLDEKPARPRSNYAVTGLYFYDEGVVDRARTLKPSARGELEISDRNRLYLESGDLGVEIMGRGHAWLDTGTHDSFLEAGHFISTLQKRQGLKVACREEIAWRNGWIDAAALAVSAEPLAANKYGRYLMRLVDERVF